MYRTFLPVANPSARAKPGGFAVAASFVTVITAVIFISCATTGEEASGSGEILTADREIELGDAVAPVLEADFGGVVDDLTAAAIIEDFGRRVTPEDGSAIPYRFALLKSDLPDSFALPGGRIYLTCGLVVRLEQDRELAAALAHQVGHLEAGHLVAVAEREIGEPALGTTLAAMEGSTEEREAAGARWAEAIPAFKYTSAEEAEVDARSIEYLRSAGYDPVGIIELIEIGEAANRRNGVDVHPVDPNRIDKIRKMIGESAPGGGDEGGASPDFRSLQAAVRSIMAEEIGD